MFFALEAILGDYRLQHLVPVALAAVVGAETSHLLAGTEPLFFLEAEQRSGWAAAGALPLAIITTLCVLAFLEILSRSERIFSRALRWPLIRAASGGLLVGILGLVDPRILGEGYGVIDDILGGDVTPLLLSLAGLLALKAIATGATLGSGGAGGVFAPSLVLGAVLGLLFAQVVNQAVGRPVLQPEFFALMGMSAFVAGLLHAPLTGTFLAAEITGGFSVLPPMLLVSVMTYTMVRRIRPRSFYHEELGSTTHGHWQSLDQRALASLNLLEVLDPQIPVVPGDTDIPALREVLERSDRRWVIVEDRKAAEEAAGDLAGARLGLIDVLLCRDLLDPSVGFSAGVTARDLVDPRVPCLPDTTSAREVLAAIEAAGVEAALIEHYGTPLGIVEVSALLHLYRLEISVQEHH
jgi:CIC family chloride channel protein